MGWPAEHCLASERHIVTLSCAICLDILKVRLIACACVQADSVPSAWLCCVQIDGCLMLTVRRSP